MSNLFFPLCGYPYRQLLFCACKKAFPLLPKMVAVGRVYYMHRYIVVYTIYECLIDLYLTSSRSQRVYSIARGSNLGADSVHHCNVHMDTKKKKRKLTSNSPLTGNFGNNNSLIANFYNRTITIDSSTTTQKHATSKNGTKRDPRNILSMQTLLRR